MVDKHAKITGRTTKKVERGGGWGCTTPQQKSHFSKKEYITEKKKEKKLNH